MRSGTCKACGASIIWIGMSSGKSMPCDDTPIYYKINAKGKEKIITPNGVVITCDKVTNPDEADGIGYISHFGTCPAADKFRKKK